MSSSRTTRASADRAGALGPGRRQGGELAVEHAHVTRSCQRPSKGTLSRSRPSSTNPQARKAGQRPLVERQHPGGHPVQAEHREAVGQHETGRLGADAVAEALVRRAASRRSARGARRAPRRTAGRGRPGGRPRSITQPCVPAGPASRARAARASLDGQAAAHDALGAEEALDRRGRRRGGRPRRRRRAAAGAARRPGRAARARRRAGAGRSASPGRRLAQNAPGPRYASRSAPGSS